MLLMSYWQIAVVILAMLQLSLSRRSFFIAVQQRQLSLFSLKQSLNLPGLKALGLLFTQPKMLIPDTHARNIQSIDINELERLGVRCIVFDKDNTLSYCYADDLHPSARPVVEKCRAIFGSNIAILSNSAGSCDDKDFTMAVKTEQHMGIPVIRHKIKKPECLNEVLTHFNNIQSNTATPSTTTPDNSPIAFTPAQICVIGDRLLTDVVFANKYGMRSVLVGPLSHVRDHPIAIVIRLFESYILLPLARLIVALQMKRR